MTRRKHGPNQTLLRGHDSWKKWHKAVLVQLDIMGLRHLLSADLRSMSHAEHYEYAADQRRAIQLLVNSISEPVLQRLWNCGWEMAGATLKNTLALLTDLLAEPERHPQQSYETHRDIVDLARMDLTPGSHGLDQFLSDAQQCHLRLLARYGNGNGSVEELLEHLFTSSVMEGLKAAKPDEYMDWMQALDEKTRLPFFTQMVSLVQGPRLDTMGKSRVAGAPRRPRDWERMEWDRRRARRLARRSRGAWRLPPFVPHHKRYRGTEYPDKYHSKYEENTTELGG